MKYKIGIGKHSSRVRIKPFFGDSLHGNFMFTDSCRYSGTAQLEEQINKLFGFSHLYHHYNSFRFGWRYNKLMDAIDIFSYSYQKWKRNTEQIYRVGFNECNKFIIEFFGKYITYIINDNYVHIEENKLKIENAFGYELFPYFGGLEPAHNEIIINECD